MGNTTGNNVHHKKKKVAQGDDPQGYSSDFILGNQLLDYSSEAKYRNEEFNNDHKEWIRQIPQDMLGEILEFADLHPRTILSLQTLSSYWRGVFKSSNIWKLMCKHYGMSSAYFNDYTDYFKLFLSRYSVTFISEKSSEYFLKEYNRRGDYSMFFPVEASNIPGQPNVLVGQMFMNDVFDKDLLRESWENYDRVFKNQPVHPNLAVQNIFKQDSMIVIYSEPSDDYLADYLISNPQMVTEANVCDIIKQILLAVDWLAERKVFSYYLNLENFRVNVLPDHKVQIKFYSATFDLSGNGSHTQVPPEILVVEPTTDKTYSWMIGWIAFLLLEGVDPFFGDTTPQTFEAIINAEYSFAESKNNHVIPLARDFISKLLVKEQSARMSLKDALKHEWIQSPNKSHEPMQHVVEGLKNKYKKTDY